MTSLTRLSLANRLLVGLVTLAIVVAGVLSTRALKQELLPSAQVPTAVITGAYPGASPQIVADEVSGPIEDVVKGISGVTRVESDSSAGYAQITVQWDYGLDTDEMVADIRSAIDGVPTLPEGLETEVLTGGTDDIPVLQLAVASDGTIAETTKAVEEIAVSSLSAIEGVRQVVIGGQNVTELVVTLRPGDVRRFDLQTEAVIEAIRARATVTPAGTAYAGNTELAVEVGTSVTAASTLAKLPITTPDGPVPLERMAAVAVQSIQSSSIARADGRPALSLTVMKKAEADAVEISHAVNAALPELERQMGANTTFTTAFDQAPFIEQSIEDLAIEGALGLAFAVIVIMIFLLSVRSTLITAISMPLSLLITMIGLRVGDYSLNIFTLAAMTVAIGRVVDDSIVVTENIKRRNAGHVTLTPADIIASVREVAGAVTASTLTTMAVFLPVAFVSGVVGELFRPFAITVALALAASLLVSLTIVPVLAYWFLRPSKRQIRKAQEVGVLDNQVTRLQRGYLPVLRFGLRHPIVTLLAAVLIFAGTLASATLLKTDFIGESADDSTLRIDQVLPAGTRLAATSEAATKIEQVLAGKPEITTYLTLVGNTGMAAFGAGGGANAAVLTLTLADGVAAGPFSDQLQTELNQLQDAGEITVVRGPGGGPTSTDISVTVSAEDPAVLRESATEVEQLMVRTAGLSDVRSNLSEQRMLLKVDLNQQKAASLGFTQTTVGQAVATALTGTDVGRITSAGETSDIVVRTAQPGASPATVADLELPISPTQQQLAQDKAAAELEAKQDRSSAEAKQDAKEAADKQQAELQEQRTTAENSLADARRELTEVSNSTPPTPPVPPPAPTVPAPLPSGPGNPVVTQQQLEQAQAQERAQQNYVLAQQQYEQQVTQRAQQIAQLESAIEQAEAAVEQLNDQLDASQEQVTQQNEQTAEQEQLAEEQRKLADVRAAPIRVRDIATVTEVLAPTTVTQIDGTPTVTVTATPTTSDLGALTGVIEQELAEQRQPAGVTVTVGGASAEQQEAFSQLGLAMLLAIGLVFLIMVAAFRSLVQPLILLVSIPFAATGAVGALLLTDTPLGVPAMVGALMLIGIVVTNAIVLIDLINQYRQRGEELRPAIVDGARLRLRPIVMTACATIFALLPMAIGLTGGGAFISRPLAVVVIGGLVSSTILTLLLVPVLYSLVERRGEKKRLRTAALSPQAGQPAEA